jgi:protein-S-isoprenylcysteine O-methyltransferase Ste14
VTEADTGRRTSLRPALGSALFFALAPGVAAGLVPWLITGWEAESMPLALRILGALLVGAGVPVLVAAFARFVTEGRGTPAPVAPTERLVVGGLYRWVRNPMYVAVSSVIAGQALLLGSVALTLYLAAFVAAVTAFVKLYEEPTLVESYGAEYEAYRRAVPGWRPRLRPWRPGSG